MTRMDSASAAKEERLKAQFAAMETALNRPDAAVLALGPARRLLTGTRT